MCNFKLFDGPEYESWARKRGLSEAERQLFEAHLSHLERDGRVLDVGTGNGRFLFELAAMGFRCLDGIDLSRMLLARGRARAEAEGVPIGFSEMDATSLAFEQKSFAAVLMLQQVLSFLPGRADRMRALEESWRVLRPGGTLLLSVLPFQGRRANPFVSAAATVVKICRKEAEYRDRRYLPWLRRGGRINVAYLVERQPYTYWFENEEIMEMVVVAGFRILEARTAAMILSDRGGWRDGGVLYVVGEKPKGSSDSRNL